MLQLSIIITAAIILVTVLVILLRQTFKSKRLMNKPKPDEDIRHQNTWASDYKKSYFNHK